MAIPASLGGGGSMISSCRVSAGRLCIWQPESSAVPHPQACVSSVRARRLMHRTPLNPGFWAHPSPGSLLRIASTWDRPEAVPPRRSHGVNLCQRRIKAPRLSRRPHDEWQAMASPYPADSRGLLAWLAIGRGQPRTGLSLRCSLRDPGSAGRTPPWLDVCLGDRSKAASRCCGSGRCVRFHSS